MTCWVSLAGLHNAIIGMEIVVQIKCTQCHVIAGAQRPTFNDVHTEIFFETLQAGLLGNTCTICTP